MPAGIYKRPSLEERFWKHTNRKSDKECWEWIASLYWDGYGQLSFNSKKLKAHRVSYEINKGKIPNGMLVLHTCDNPKCVNPEHLFLGDHNENMKDMVIKDRSLAGTKNAMSKLSCDDVKAIKNTDDVQSKIASMFNVSQSLVSLIKCNKVWKHV